MIIIAVTLPLKVVVPMMQVPTYKIAFRVLEELKENNPSDSFVLLSTNRYKNIRSYTCFEWKFENILSMI